MHNYKFDDVVTNKVMESYEKNKSTNNIDKLVKQLHNTNQMFTMTDVPEYESVSFERLDNISKSAKEIENEAKNSLADYKNTALSKIENDINSKAETLQANKEDLIQSKDESVNNIKNYYDKAVQSVSDDALRRGLARSSIVINQIDAFNKDELQAYKNLETEFNNSLNAINFEINSLNQQKQQAINDFDIVYAVKLNDKISELNESLRKKQDEIIKYNNEIAEKEKEYQLKYDELVNDIKDNNSSNNLKMSELVAKYGQNAIEGYRKKQLNDIVDGYFADMTKDEILDLLSNNEDLRRELGSEINNIILKYN